MLLFDPAAGRRAAEESRHKSPHSEPMPDERVLVTFQVGVTPETVGRLLYYGGRAQVAQPRWLKERVREEHRRAAEAAGGGA